LFLVKRIDQVDKQSEDVLLRVFVVVEVLDRLSGRQVFVKQVLDNRGEALTTLLHLLVELDTLHEGVVPHDLLEVFKATADSDQELAGFQADSLDLGADQVLALLKLVERDKAAENGLNLRS
jgi:hypothetical protein